MKKIIVFFCFCFNMAHSQTWEWVKQNGGTSPANGRAICTDDHGNCYTVGDSAGIAKIIQYDALGNAGWNMNAWEGEATAVTNHAEHLFVAGDSSGMIKIAKYDYTGNILLKINGGNGYCYGIRLDSAGNIYTAGNSLTKYDPSGNQLWSIALNAVSNAIAINISGNSYLTGYFESTVSFGSYMLTAKGSRDIFIACYDPAGNCLWAKRAGGNHNICCYSNDNGNAITIDDAGNSYITGSITDTADFDSFILTALSNDIFIAKYDPSGNALWVTQATGSSDQEGRCIALDNDHNILIGGSFVPNVNFNGYAMSGWGNYDAFIAKYNNNGNFVTAIKAGEPLWNEFIYGISTDYVGNIFFAGSFCFTSCFGTDILNTSGNFNSCTGKIDLQTGINELAVDEGYFHLYPNPSINQITIELSEALTQTTILQIKNALGQPIKILQLTKGSKQQDIDISDLANGFYFVQLQNGDRVISKKFIKE